ncbi:hypothetical protein [Mesorhizobium japonicum]|uniref:hypothetical protein n=1 Tax=Mesorhizobium japonicum TaxID=2066070 RepID=UPI003B59BAE2
MFRSGKWNAALVAGLAHGLVVLAIPSTMDLDICPIVGGFELEIVVVDPAAPKYPVASLVIPGSRTCVTIDYGDEIPPEVDPMNSSCGVPSEGAGSQPIEPDPYHWSPPQQIAFPPFSVPIWVQWRTVVLPPADCVAANTVPPA